MILTKFINLSNLTLFFFFFGLHQDLRMLPNTADVKEDAWRDGSESNNKDHGEGTI